MTVRHGREQPEYHQDMEDHYNTYLKKQQTISPQPTHHSTNESYFSDEQAQPEEVEEIEIREEDPTHQVSFRREEIPENNLDGMINKFRVENQHFSSRV